MDVLCSCCREPWDTEHLLHDSIYETVASDVAEMAWRRLPIRERLARPYRAMLNAEGYEFGKTLMHLVRCPCCPKGAALCADLVSLKLAIEELFGDDLDAIAVTFCDRSL